MKAQRTVYHNVKVIVTCERREKIIIMESPPNTPGNEIDMHDACISLHFSGMYTYSEKGVGLEMV